MTKNPFLVTVDLVAIGGPLIESLIVKERLEKTHAGTVVALAKPGVKILDDATPQSENQLIAAMQLFIEAGQRLDLAKKQYYYAKEQKALQTDTAFLCQCETAEEFAIRMDSDANGRAEKLHMAIGIAGEASELLESIFNESVYVPGQGENLGERDRVNEVEELGDLEFYMQGFRRLTGITRSETLEENIDKLSKRYPTGGYSDAQAIARADKLDDNVGLRIQESGFAKDFVSTGDTIIVDHKAVETLNEVREQLNKCWAKGYDGKDIVLSAARWLADTIASEKDNATRDAVVHILTGCMNEE